MKQCYVITDGKRYIKQDMSGKHKLVSNVTIADFWDTKNKAESVMFNSVPPHMRYDLYVAKVDDAIVEPVTKTKREIDKRRECVRVECDNSYELSKYSFEKDEDIQNMIKGFEEVRKILEIFSDKQHIKQLDEKTLYMDWVVEDIKHYHGRKALNSRDGFKLNKLEDKAIIKRISTKNQLEIAREINKCSSIIAEHINAICDVIDTVRKQRYKPRVLVDLFENNNLDIEF